LTFIISSGGLKRIGQADSFGTVRKNSEYNGDSFLDRSLREKRHYREEQTKQALDGLPELFSTRRSEQAKSEGLFEDSRGIFSHSEQLS